MSNNTNSPNNNLKDKKNNEEINCSQENIGKSDYKVIQIHDSKKLDILIKNNNNMSNNINHMTNNINNATNNVNNVTKELKNINEKQREFINDLKDKKLIEEYN